jgi:CBS domain-containing protein
MAVPVREVMKTDLVTVNENLTVGEAATMMGLRRIGSILVLEGERLIGIFTERDIVHALSQDIAATGEPISYFMTRNPVTITPETDAQQALELMLERHFRHLPVMDSGRLVGMVSIRDLSAATTQG